MTVEAIRLKNFMAFEDTDWLELRPITLLFGRNSSGKSTVIRALRLLRQSLDIPRSRGALLFSSPQGLDLGPYKETVHRSLGSGKLQNEDQLPRMAFGFRCRLPTTLDKLWSLLKQHLVARNEEMPARESLPNVVEIMLTFEAARNDEQARLSEVNVTCASASNGVTRVYNIFSALRLDEEAARTFGEEWWFASDLLTSSAGSSSDWWRGWGIETDNSFLPRIAPITRQGAAQSQPQRDFVAQLLGDTNKQVTEFLQNTIHLGPMRPESRRAFAYGRVDLEALENAGGRGLVKLLQGEVDHNALLRIDAWLVATELANTLVIRQLGSAEDVGVLAQLVIQDQADLPVNLVDVGFGVSQVLPILVECATAEPGELVIVEQPELHLHSSAQAKLGDLFIEAILRKLLDDWRIKAQEAFRSSMPLPDTPVASGASPAPGPRFLIETHSEHFLLRLRRRIAETLAFQTNKLNLQSDKHEVPDWPLAAGDLRVYFLFREESLRSRVVQIGIDKQGGLVVSDAPTVFEDFFADDLIELAALARALP